MIREADELYQKLRAVPQGDDKPWIQPWLDEELYPETYEG
jgi:hypothetical protein